METSSIEKFYRNGRDFFVVVWDKGNGVFYEEIFEAKKIGERHTNAKDVNDALTQGKQNIETGIATKSI